MIAGTLHVYDSLYIKKKSSQMTARNVCVSVGEWALMKSPAQVRSALARVDGWVNLGIGIARQRNCFKDGKW